MWSCWTQIERLGPDVQALTPIERLHAARGPFSGLSSGAAWIIVVVGLVVLVGLGILVVALLGLRRRRRQRRQFQARADQLGLSRGERDVLRRLARQAGLKRSTSVFTMVRAFERGADMLLGSERLVRASEDQRAKAAALLERLREKLGFDGAATAARPEETAIGDIHEGTQVHVYRPQAGDYFDGKVVQDAKAGAELEVLVDITERFQLGERWEIRFSDGKVLWEMNGSVLKQTRNQVSLNLIGPARSINRRRFARAPTSKPAYVASFMFEKDATEPDPPPFLPAALVEIAGPGLKLESPLEVAVGDKILVGVQFSDGRVVQGQATVRRTGTGEGGLTSLAVEMIGLTTSEVAELTRETIVAMKAGQTGPDGQAEQPAAQKALTSEEG